VIEREQIANDGGVAAVWTGGEGDPLVLLHGGWGGAQMHWAPVWDELARTFRVIAPELPGFAEASPQAPRSLTDAAAWVDAVLEAIGTPAAWIAGNSLGAAVASYLGARSPQRCKGLILIDGGPPPRTPEPVRRLMTRRRLRKALVATLRRSAWRPSSLPKAFADPGRAPADLRAVLADPAPRQFAVVSEIFTAGDPPPALPPVPTLVVWGAEDRLPGTSVRSGRRLARSLGAELVVIPDAGHLPQVEHPEQVARAVVAFVRTPPSAPG